MSVIKSHPFDCEPINTWRRYPASLAVVTLDISISKIVCVDDHDIGAIVRLDRFCVAETENETDEDSGKVYVHGFQSLLMNTLQQLAV